MCPQLSPRAQRSNPESLRGRSLDCFVARAPRNDGCRSSGTRHSRVPDAMQRPLALQRRAGTHAARIA
ncbi:hypothetical protein EAS62_01655 [Bradyrhizobium zhanjiangense]|uniref:Uncharacterized protein n=1 Tax=Bradyrhizobium zhanjiangense TaxID=1325107 RepID=A0ABY0DVP6_9BRAD|nr:hypothetical protein EAS62_01655 [Bradyrhizobium zhanjiangense]